MKEQDAATVLTAEEIFDAYFRDAERSEEDRQLYCGRDSLWGIATDQRDLLQEIQAHLNQLWSRARNSSAEIPRIHLDFIDTRHCGAGDIRDRRVINAVAFEDRGIAFIGLTRDLIEELFRTSSLLAQSQRVRDGFRIFPSSKNLAGKLAGALFSAQLVFVTNHELGHHVHGHVRAKRARSLHVEFSQTQPVDQASALVSQRCEIDADGYAVHSGLNNFLLTQGPRKSTLLSIGRPECHPLADQWLTRLYFLAAAAFFFSRPGVERPKDGRVLLAGLTHPPGLIRMHYVMHQIRAWAAHNSRRQLEKWASEARFQTLMAAIEDAIGTEHQEIDWYEQSRFTTSEEGHGYRAILEEYEAPVRELFTGKRWSVP